MTEAIPDGGTLAELLARQAITDALHRYCWGIDRGELGLVLSAFHEDARDNHSGTEQRATDRFRRTVVEGGPMRTSHMLTNIHIQVQGNNAVSQACFLASHQFEHQGEVWNWIINGRYLDRFACRDGDWRIVHRTVVYDMERFESAGRRPIGHPAEPFFAHAIHGEKSRSDPSFELFTPNDHNRQRTA